MNDKPISSLFGAIVRLAEARGETPINTYEPLWEAVVDERWRVAVNPYSENRKDSSGVDVPPYHAYLEFNGWPAGLLTPYEGTVAAGDAANESTAIAAIESAIERLRGEP